MTTVRANGIDLRVSRFRTGNGPEDRPVVVFVHGLVVDHSGLGFTLGMPFSTRAEVILYDLRGHGRSQFVPSGYRVADHVADLVALLDALEVTTPVHLVAGSYGGAVGTVAAVLHPDRVASLSLIEGLIPHEGWGGIVAGTLEQAAEGLRGEYTTAEAMQVLQLTSARKADAIVSRTRRLILETTLLADVRQEPALSRDDYARIECPILGLYGDRSDFYPLADLLETLVPGAEVHLFPGVDHAEIFWRTKTLKAVIGDFIGLCSGDDAGPSASSGSFSSRPSRPGPSPRGPSSPG